MFWRNSPSGRDLPGTHPGEEGLLLLDDHIHRDADKQRWREVEYLVEDRAERCEADPAAVGPGILEKSPQRTGLR